MSNSVKYKFLMIIEQVPKNPDLGADAERVRKEEQGKIDESEVLTEEELAEKEDLLKEVRGGGDGGGEGWV